MNTTDDMKNSSGTSLNDFKVQAMESMGWSAEAEIPMANEENLAILKEMVAMRALKFDLQQQIKTLEDREGAVERHKKNIDATVQQNITLYNSMKEDLVKEAHNVQLVVLEKNKIKEDLRKNQKELEEYTQHAEFTERKIQQNKKEIDELTSRIKSAKSTLQEWQEAMEDGNKGYQLIEKYYEDDQQRARELNTRRQQLQAEIDKRRKKVVQMYDEQNTLEKNLERTACLYRAAHQERRQMVDTWKQAVNQMTQRERDIQSSEESLVKLSKEATEMAAQYKLYDDQLNEVIDNNRQVEIAIEALNAETSDMKNEIQRLIDASILKDHEIDGLRKELENLSNSVAAQRMENRKLMVQQEEKKKSIENLEETIKQTEERLQAMKNKALNAEERLQILDEMMENEEKTLATLSKEQERVNEMYFRAQRQLAELKSEEKTLLMQNESLKSNLSSMKRNHRQTYTELQRQTEIHYQIAFKYLEAQRRYDQMTGTTIDPIVEERNQAILSGLEQHYDKLQRHIAATEAQNKKLNYNMNNMVIQYNNDAKELDSVRFKIKEAQVYCEGTVKRLKQNRFENSELIVELSMIKMRCDDMEVGINGCEQGTYDLEQHRLNFQRSVKDRFVELRSQEEILQLKRKHLGEEMSTLRADLAERKKHIEAVRARFELTSRLLGCNEDGSVMSATQLKVANAQERQMLADEGDALNKKVLKAEQEVVALENTLRQFDHSNDNYRKTFKTSDDDQEDSEEKLKELQLVYCKDLQQLKTLRCKAKRYENKMDELKLEQEEAQKQVETARARRAEHKEILEKLRKELEEQNSKIDRANRDIRSLLKDIKTRPISDEFLATFERELTLQELEQRNMKALNLLTDMANTDENGPEIIHYMLRKGLKLPQHLKRTRSCVSWRSQSTSSRDNGSYISVTGKGYSARSSASDLSSIKEDSSVTSAHVSVVSLDFPMK
ncbi:uncharacterized protein Dwil_GK14425 [Drosophila willistoni]|uniref:Coiled-coil domain-containing protein 39 n=1 Tax=Drosophila willistoni TaxID=7260 RepID=B4NJR2_DROWI|nr:coiled-coil domain-containing protein 39 [Drosophila willistoni]EDW85024.2 uncharacterized protein Dwil_GK14425 [Drosophila willistoni]